MQYQTTCQKCGTSNRPDAVVCIQCGARLAHPERRAYRKFAASGIPQQILALPWRFGKWLFRRLVGLLTLVFLLVLFGGGGLFAGLFVPLSWPEQEMKPAASAPADHPDLKSKLDTLRRGGTVTANPAVMQQLGNQLIYAKAYGANDKNAAPAGKPDFSRGWLAVYKEGDGFYNFVLCGKWYDKLPLRVKMQFSADRAKDGKFELSACRIGNIPVSAGMAKKAARYLLDRWNPDQELSRVASRITDGKMVLSANQSSEDFSLTVAPDGGSSGNQRSK